MTDMDGSDMSSSSAVLLKLYWTKDVILKELSGVSVTHAVDPRLAIENVWQSLITLGRFSHPPKLAEIDSVIPNSILPKDKEDKTKFLQALGGNIIECKRVALLPKFATSGSPDHQTFGMVERFTFSPKFFPSKSTVPEDIAVYVNIGREGEVKGWGFQGRIAGLVVAEHQADSPGLEIGEPGVEQPVTRGGLTGIAITLPGRLNDAANHRVGLVAHFTFPNGQPLFANASERRYRDWQGFVATNLEIPYTSGDTIDLGKYKLFIPYYALNLAPTGGRAIYTASVAAGVYVDGIETGRTNPIIFSFRW